MMVKKQTNIHALLHVCTHTFKCKNLLDTYVAECFSGRGYNRHWQHYEATVKSAANSSPQKHQGCQVGDCW